MNEPDDPRLLRDLRAGRPEACAELVRGQYQRVYRFLIHLTRDVHQAEDLTQETFATAWERLCGFEGRSSLATWLHRIAYTKFIDAQRAQRRAADFRAAVTTRHRASSEPADSVMADDETRRLHRAMEELEAGERTVLILHYLQGLSYREMAQVLDEPTGTLKWRTSAALSRLRIVLGDEVPNHATPRNS